MLARLRDLDTDAKRGAFVIAALYAAVFLAGFALFVATGYAGLMLAAVALFALTAGVAALAAGLWRAAVRLFPDTKN